jgi:hypothetical protein
MERLQKARLDGEIASKDDEVELVKGWLTDKGSS